MMNSLKLGDLSSAAGQYVSSSEERTLSCLRIFSLHKILLEPNKEDDSSDSDIIEPTRKRGNLIDSDVKENIPVEDNISSSEKCPTQTLYFTNELVDNIIKETNYYANEKIRNKELLRKSTWHKWHGVSKQEFLAFIAVILNMIKDRFFQIFWTLHLKKPTRSDSTIRTRIQKASNYLVYIDSKFRYYFIPDKAICVDESVHNVRKHSRPDFPVSTKIPLYLYKKLLEKVSDAEECRTDKYYGSIILAEELLRMKSYHTIVDPFEINELGDHINGLKIKLNDTNDLGLTYKYIIGNCSLSTILLMQLQNAATSCEIQSYSCIYAIP
ncbi:hypothetical protein HZH66_013969 [Vespula vulgaris]|uniref:PiggyBac transposable element-derived protein domain-containing protein n=1 Tax=Vespula vulgaris TaxID=7454 RepID=A0A834MR43_VESVU|nr:hypothetical protein HZH66_013969 [Vespula vulgaris]